MELVQKFIKTHQGEKIIKHEGNFSPMVWGSSCYLLYSPLLHKYYPQDFTFGTLMFLAGNGTGIGVFSMDNYINCSNFTFEKYLKDPGNFTEFKDCKNIAKQVKKAYKKYPPAEIAKLSEEGIVKLVLDTYQLFIDWQVSSLFCEAIDENIVKKYYLQEGGRLESFSEFMEYISVIDFESLVLQFQEKYLNQADYTAYEMQYIITDYFQAPLLKDVPEKIKEAIEDNGGYDKLEKQVTKTKQELVTNKGEVEEYYQSLDPKLQRVFKFAKDSIELRDVRKEDSLRGIVIVSNALRELFKRFKISEDKIVFSFLKDFQDKLYKRKDYNELLIKRRDQGFVAFYFQEGVETAHSDYQQVREEIFEVIDKQEEHSDDVRGMTACKGRITGKVKVILERKEFFKFKQGDILVTSMTRPEFVPLMKKAAGVVTDEGGISCHAAIISRELGIPCIIGTKTATRRLKDGDQVEVNADRGIVKII